MNTIKDFECTRCHHHFSRDKSWLTCPDCHGILEINYDYEALAKMKLKDCWKKTPMSDIWRYLPLIGIDSTRGSETLRVGNTPLYHASRLGAHLNLPNLFVKDEGMNPTQSLKDRASVVAALQALEQHRPVIACASTGNAASSLAGNAAKLGLSAVIFVPARAPAGKMAQLLAYDATVIRVEGDYQAAFSLSQAAIDRFGWVNRNAAINPFLIEGKKTVALEIAEQMDYGHLDWVVVSVGDGCTIGGVYKGFYDLQRLGYIDHIPRILGVQADGCNPFYQSFISKKPLEPMAENTVADSIAVGIPRNPFKAFRAVEKSAGSWVSVTDQKILEGMRLLGKMEGIFAEPAAAAGIAGLIQAVETGIINKTDTVVCISTGNGLKDTKTALTALKEPISLPNDLTKMIDYFTQYEGALTQ
jgi:threonine synthase